jgi:hypothetical protein
MNNARMLQLNLISLMQASIRESLVLPNSDSVCIPWMIAEKDDWVQKKVAPFMWLNQDAIYEPTSGREVPTSQSCEAETKTEVSRGTSSDPESKNQKPKNSESISESSDPLSTSTRSVHISGTSQELRTPLLLRDDEPQETCKQVEEIPESRSTSRSMISFEKQDSTTDDDDSRPKRVGGRRARMLDFSKKVGEKLEEKRRNIEEKGRNIVEKMRGP